LEITIPILLDEVTAKLKSVVIKDGGRLVFSPDVDHAKISSDYIMVQTDGYFEIGSSDCPFEGNAEVLLTGIYSDIDANNIDGFGQKFLGVSDGGTIEIHGEQRGLSWTK
jgi:hypothetical protein